MRAPGRGGGERLVPDGDPLVCPSCGEPHGSDERFCRSCGLPLVFAPGTGDPAAVGPLHERARKVRPQYAEGPLVRVAAARHQAEAELIEGILLEEGVPALVRRSGGFDVPDFLASGPRDILVPASGAEVAREALGLPPLAGSPAARPRSTVHGRPPWVRVLAIALAAVIVALVIAGLVIALVTS
jgi:hypothetical protein